MRDASGAFLPESQILGAIKAILADNSPKDQNPVGILTTENRDKWAEIHLDLYATNKKALDDVDSALFALSLESQSVEDPTKLSRLFLFGDGRNRWFDKSFSLLVTENGKAAVNFEHSWGDGVAVVRFLDEVYGASNASPLVQAASGFRAPEKIQWNVRALPFFFFSVVDLVEKVNWLKLFPLFFLFSLAEPRGDQRNTGSWKALRCRLERYGLEGSCHLHRQKAAAEGL